MIEKINSIYSFFERMEENNILFSFHGEISSELVSSILAIVEANLENAAEEVRVKKKVYNVLVECLQNLYHHLEDVSVENKENKKLRTAIFMIGKINNKYTIMTGNYIKNTNVPALQKRLNDINSMSKEELREHYISTMAEGGHSQKGGGGLGLIDIIRKTGEKLIFHFIPVEQGFSFFELQIKIAK